MHILHLSFDHPDQINPNKTKAIRNLHESLKGVEHFVISMNRSARLWDNFDPAEEKHGLSMRVFGLPLGILLNLWMFLASRRIEKILINKGLKPELIHAHKLSFEGIIAWHLSKRLHIPYILTIRGNTDLKLIQHRRLHRYSYKRIMNKARSLLFLAPWTIGRLEQYFPNEGIREKARLIPNIVNLHEGTAEPFPLKSRFVTVFHLKNLKLKNIARVIQAFDLILEQHPELGLDIIGSGPEEDLLRSLISKSSFPDRYKLLGAMDNKDLVQALPAYQGFILPSFPETFGIVFMEALSAGIPIIYSENSGIDGYFQSYLIGEKVRHNSVEQIKGAIDKLRVDNARYRVDIQKLKDSGELKAFSREEVGRVYGSIISTLS